MRTTHCTGSINVCHITKIKNPINLKNMPSNPQNVIRSWNTQANFSNGRVVMDRLTPPAFTRIRNNFIMTWREDNAVVNNLDWGDKSFSVYLPESLRVIQNIYLRIECPEITGGTNFKEYPGLQIIKSIRVLSGGTESYTADCEKFLSLIHI